MLSFRFSGLVGYRIVRSVLFAEALHAVRVVVDHRFHRRVDVVYPLDEIFERRLVLVVDFVFVIADGLLQYAVFVLVCIGRL